ncbi:hypothetical protein SAICODRAFT_8051 [Saitoella complicata NRRL Y-17804]|nr:uncharacterized protein SAICODRAFT_10632 [Saitoella complicata NRRL Y-17804]XP_019023332.1 uncharacterized protein SAICODRAFT_8051 [Saitoella complicata NRRL Y-17804]ODQ49609.1 hypothetical protein SAICODRAFT_10632 [Saitoella complicata NRRL Y-17804]ODQ52219.1 hypothetical protein SAICODRAFT_8051 [Saitoella complicata NRRL Y-17804]
MDAITVYYNEVRFFQVVDEFVVPLIYRILQTATVTASQVAVSGYLGTATAADLTGVAGSLLQASAPLEAGLIHYLIFCLHVALFLNTAREPLQKILKYSSSVIFRIAAPAAIYVVLSLWYTLINLTFHVPLWGGLGAVGFWVFRLLAWISGLSIGLAMESMITILGPSFLPFFPILWLVLDISSSFFPPDVQQRFYRYRYAMPFYHNTQAT